jgi:phosphopantothenoylcysteine decarboxylase/phosphopantothenate--cysteine ligase
MIKAKILFKLSGSIACFKSAALISKLVQNGYDVQTVATKSALQFIGEATLEGLTGHPVLTETFARGEYMQHIHLAKWADLVILAPASANTLNKFSAGLADDLVTTLFLAHDFKKPYLVAPAMNSNMYSHPATQSSLQRLRDWGVQILEPAHGNLACGDVGAGRLLEPEQMYSAIEAALMPQTSHSKQILITSGGTREAIDGVRTLANVSTGRTGVAIAETLVAHGHHVTLLRAQDSATSSVAAQSNGDLRTKSYVSFQDLDALLKTELREKNYDAILHLAAVSDYSVDHLEVAGDSVAVRTDLKIDSQKEIAIHLKRNFKIVDHLKEYSRNPNLKIVAFKLTKGLSKTAVTQKVLRLLETSKADFVVHNDLGEISPSGSQHKALIFDRNGQIKVESQTKKQLALEIEKLILEKDAQP